MTTALRHPWSLRRNDRGFTQESLADSIGVTRHMVLRLEQGLFAEPPPDLLVKIGFRLDASLPELLEEYFAYVKDARNYFREHNLSIERALKHYLVEKEDVHPLVFYREMQDLSRIGLCKGLCLHQDPIRDYENNQQRGVPSQLVAALKEINWPVEPLEEAVKEWRIKWH